MAQQSTTLLVMLEAEITVHKTQLLHALPESTQDWYKQAQQALTQTAKTSNKTEILATQWAYWSAQATYQSTTAENITIDRKTAHSTPIEQIRLQLLAHLLLQINQQNRVSVLTTCLRYADDQEKQAIIKGLPLLDTQGAIKNQIVNQCRTNNADLFAAIALQNAWPAEHFTAAEFAQMVLKALFLNLDITLIIGIPARHTPQMSQQAYDYLTERIAAGRDYPHAIYTIIKTEHLTDEHRQRLSKLPDTISQQLYGTTTI